MATSTIFFIIAGVLVLFRLWVTEPRPANDGATLITGAIMFAAFVAAVIGGLCLWAGR